MIAPTVVRRKKIVRTNITISISKRLQNYMRNAAYWTPGTSMSSLVEEAVTVHIQMLEAKRGKKFVKRKVNLKPGPKVVPKNL